MADNPSIPRGEFEDRLERTHTLMKERDLRGLIVFSGFQEREGHICYLTNHRNSFPNVLSHTGLGYSALVLPADGPGILVSPIGYQAENVVNVDSAKTGFLLVADVVEAVKEKGLDGKRLGVAGLDLIPAEYFEGIRRGLGNTGLEPANDLLESMRIIKSDAEIALLDMAAQAADAGLIAGMEAAREGATGHDVELAARKAALGAGADFIPRIRVASGPTLQTLSWPPTTRQEIAGGDFVYIDVIGWLGGYGFDNSRIKVVGGATDEQRDYLEHMAEATEWMVGMIKPGAQLSFVLTMHRERQIMPFGHGIGLEICEFPWLTVGHQKVKIEANMVLTVEPKLLDRRFGGAAIEDTILVTQSGAKVLNRCPRLFL